MKKETEVTTLSLAAQAVWDAFDQDAQEIEAVAAVLRAVAELLSQEVEAPKVDGSKYAGLWHSHDYLNAIADELEGA